MNILTSNGLVERFVVDSLGPDTELKGIAIRLGAPAYPYDTLTFSGTVTEIADGVADAACEERDRGVAARVLHPVVDPARVGLLADHGQVRRDVLVRAELARDLVGRERVAAAAADRLDDLLATRSAADVDDRRGMIGAPLVARRARRRKDERDDLHRPENVLLHP